MLGSLFIPVLLVNYASAAPATFLELVEAPFWAALNLTVGGRLQLAVPFSRPCFSRIANGVVVPSNEASCNEIQLKNEDHLFRSSKFGAYQNTQWETCQTTGDGCLLDWEAPFNTTAFSPPRQCLQGSIPNRYIDVKQASDVSWAFAFSRITRVPLVIKNTGHDYIGRSSGQGTLALWTHNLDKLEMNKAFVPSGCPRSTTPTVAMTIGAGVQFQAVYDFSRKNNVTFLGGSDQSVGASGGWLMGGGHGVLTPAMGFGVDRVLEFKIVTPDGIYRTANKCQNKDLFFALRGGGGGTFGVVLESTSLVTPQVAVQVVLGRYNPTRENSRILLKALSGTAVQMATDGWGGYVTPPHGSGIWANPLLSSANSKVSAAGVVDAFALVNGSVNFFTIDSYPKFFDLFLAPNPDDIGRPQAMASRLIDASKMSDDILMDAMIDAMIDSDFSQVLAVAPYAFKDFVAGETSINPKWRTGIWHTVMSYDWNYDSSLSERVGYYQDLAKNWAIVRERTPGAAAYSNEADVYEPNFEDAFWGTNYARLLSIKNRYDPDGILDCWHCVGWQGADDSRYKCYPKTD